MMNALLNYTLEANVCLLVFLGCYQVFLAKERNFRMLRFVLLSAIIGSLTIPLFHFNVAAPSSLPSLSSVMPEHWLPTINVTTAKSTTEPSLSIFQSWLNIVCFIYAVGLFTTSLITVVRLYKIGQLITAHPKVKFGNFTLIETTLNLPTFSFFHWIFIGNVGMLTEGEKQQIIRHETIHASQLHSLDILLVAFTGIIFWFNPFVKFYRNHFIQVHEFEADEKTIAETDSDQYCVLLAKVALQSHFQMVNHFNQSLTLKRIEMMRTLKHGFSHWKLAPILFFVIACGVLIACQDQINDGKQISPSKDQDPIFMVVEDPASPIGGYDVLTTFIRDNLVYSKNAVDKGIEGTVYISFIVNKDGSISDPKLLRGIDPDLDAEAIRVVKMLPRWNPGRQNGKDVRQRFNLPIKFDLDCKNCATKETKTEIDKI
jgi:TonB family protein